MKCVDVSQTLRLFYKANQVASGQNVLFNIWDDSGNLLVSSAVGTEIGTEGVYYYEYTTPATDLYLLILASNAGNSPKPDILKVGTPSEKVFYVQGGFKSGREIGYDIYGDDGVTQQTGLLTDIVAGFYSANATGLTEPWFFQVYPYVSVDQECFSPE